MTEPDLPNKSSVVRGRVEGALPPVPRRPDDASIFAGELLKLGRLVERLEGRLRALEVREALRAKREEDRGW